MSSNVERTGSSTGEIQRFVGDWYAALDRHAPFEEVEKFLADGAIRFVFPESTVTTHDGLRGWYDTVTRKFFDEAHRVDVADVRPNGGATKVHVSVNWVTRVWTPPEPTSQILEYQADQDWEVEIGADGRPRLRTYVVTGLEPQGDTPALF
jgi:hypothetical protein